MQINLPSSVLFNLLTESESFRRYVATQITDSSPDSIRSMVMVADNKIQAIKNIRDFSRDNMDAIRKAFPTMAFDYSDNVLGLADSKRLVEMLRSVW